MLIVKTTIENGKATIYLYENQQLINGLTRTFSTNAEAKAWLKERGVYAIEDFSRFVPYVLSKGSFGRRVAQLLNEEPYFVLNGRVGVFYKRVHNCCVQLYSQVYSA